MDTPKQACCRVTKILSARAWLPTTNPILHLKQFSAGGVSYLDNTSSSGWLSKIDRIAKRGIQVSQAYELCKSDAIESLDHLLFDCTYSRFFAPATAILGKPKELLKERDAVSPLAFVEERAEKKTSFPQLFLVPASLLVKKGLFDQEDILVGRPTAT
ncbi:hypothetical protein HAX54_042066 [Datura stramonium]|uniref:Uncharacterized protein n=1 Tax=Datura stramonium TaxID=4076 RepID=A0ABS8W1W4_DATST|nr:hypothetical protein [Datura stramonium]